ncbi:MAG TPA: hypothetical protein VM689_25615 [Aliidongia sp.]|nr:hypothetical protein [Aliidongia sp.]
MNALILYYSRSGTTRAVAEALAEELGADIEEIGCGRYPIGFWGSMKAGYDSWRGKLPLLEPLRHELARYDMIVIGGPIWMSHPATPVQALLRREEPHIHHTAFFATCGGSAAGPAFAEMQLLAGATPKTTLRIRKAEVQQADFLPVLSAFARAIRQKPAPVADCQIA